MWPAPESRVCRFERLTAELPPGLAGTPASFCSSDCLACANVILVASSRASAGKVGPVSYTHLTLPTICSV
eukprot:2910348-Alexandrium_andersonii.AAC.1